MLSGGLFWRITWCAPWASRRRPTGHVHTPGGSFRLEGKVNWTRACRSIPMRRWCLPTDKAAADRHQERKNGISSVTYQTRDTRDSVDLWYSKHLGPEFSRHDAGENLFPKFFLTGGFRTRHRLSGATRPASRIVALSLNARGTSISLLSLDKAPGQ